MTRTRIPKSAKLVGLLALVLILVHSPIAVADDARIELDIKYGRALQASEQATLEKLAKPVTVEWDDISFAAAVKQISNDHSLNFVIDEWQLKNLGLNPDGKVSLRATGVPLREVLDQLCLSLKSEAAWNVKGSFVIFTNRDDARLASITRVYDVSKLVPKSDMPFRNPFLDGPGGSFSDIPSGPPETTDEAAPPQTEPQAAETAYLASDYYDFSELCDAIQDSTGGDSWSTLGTGDGNISTLVVGKTPVLVIVQSHEVHVEIATLLSQLEEFAEPDKEQ